MKPGACWPWQLQGEETALPGCGLRIQNIRQQKGVQPAQGKWGHPEVPQREVEAEWVARQTLVRASLSSLGEEGLQGALPPFLAFP